MTHEEIVAKANEKFLARMKAGKVNLDVQENPRERDIITWMDKFIEDETRAREMVKKGRKS